MKFELQGVAITGAAGGLGRAIALGLAEHGVSTICIDRHEDGVRDVAAEAERRGGRAMPIVADIASPASIAEAFETLRGRGVTLDGLVTCAGVASTTKILDLTVEEWDRVFDINLRGTFLCVQQALRIMIPNKRGRIVTVASDTGKRGGGRLSTSAYGASKGGVVILTRSLARELAPFQGAIRINGLCPGPIWTGWHTGITEADRAAVEQSVLMGRFGTPEEVAAGALFLLSDEASFVYGETLVVDGGVVLD